MNFKNLTYRKKYRLLVIGTAIFILPIYLIALRPTISRYFQNKVLEQQLTEAGRAPEIEASLNNKMAEITRCIGNDTLAEEDVGPYLLKVINSTCLEFETEIREMPEVRTFAKSGLLIQTHNIVLSGEFKNLVLTLHKLEKLLQSVKIVSVRFYTEKGIFSNDMPELYCKLFVQSYYPEKIKKDEKK